jgi:hypothetical protein
MADALRVILELGPKRRVVAGAVDWPGLDRWGTSEDAALATLTAYLPRYADVARRAGLADAFARVAKAPRVEVVERHPGSSTTDFWGIVHFPSPVEHEPMSREELERRLALLQAAWSSFNDTAGRVSAELARGPRGGGRSRDEIIVHVYASERHNWWRKVGLRLSDEPLLSPEELAAYRADYLDRIRAHHAEGRLARTWPLAFLIRRTAQHAMDHAWELEDKDLTAR